MIDSTPDELTANQSQTSKWINKQVCQMNRRRQEPPVGYLSDWNDEQSGPRIDHLYYSVIQPLIPYHLDRLGPLGCQSPPTWKQSKPY